VVLIVWNDPARVEAALISGRLSCPHCDGELRPWGSARTRTLRSRSGTAQFRPRRARCSLCVKTSVLLPDVWLARRVDEVAVIGAALRAHVAGSGHRSIAATLDRPPETVRGWLRRFSSRAEPLHAHFRRWALALDARLDEIEPEGSVVGDALEVIGLATRAASLLLGPRPPWCWASAMTAGLLLSNTSSPFPLPR
jgi:hypothetical protein